MRGQTGRTRFSTLRRYPSRGPSPLLPRLVSWSGLKTHPPREDCTLISGFFASQDTGLGGSSPIFASADFNPFNDRAPLAFQGFVNLFMNGNVRKGVPQLTLGIVASVISAGSVFGKGGGIIISEGRLTKILEAHTAGGVLSAGKSLFNASEDVTSLVRAAESTAPVAQAGGRFERVVDAGRIIGTDRDTGYAPTSIYTVITDSSDQLITAFPGRP